MLAPMELPLLPLVLVLFASLQLDAARIVAVRGAPPATWATFFAADGTFACDASSVSMCRGLASRFLRAPAVTPRLASPHCCCYCWTGRGEEAPQEQRERRIL